MNIQPIRHFLSLLLLVVVVSLCLAGPGCKSVYYAAWEKFGVEKRDLLKKRVVAARDEQKEAGQEFKDALTRLKEMTGFDGGKLEKAYTELKGDFDNCSGRADSVRKKIVEMEGVANDLFAEWEKEILQISTPSLQANSRQQLQTTRQRYEGMHVALKEAERSMGPVLAQFKDYVLVLKHNLNAQAIASLNSQATGVQSEIARLIAQMNQSIAKADEFVKGLQ